MLRIKKVLISGHNKTNGSLEAHLKRCGIRKEEIMGIDIEHLILEELMRILEPREKASPPKLDFDGARESEEYS